FEQARLAVQTERDGIAHRLHDAESTLAAIAASPRPLPGSREERAIAASVRQAEWESEHARADLALADVRLETDIAWNDVRKGFGRAVEVAPRRYTAYLRDGYLAEVREMLPHAAQRVLETRTVYQRMVQELSKLAEGHVPPQPDLIAPQLVAALELLRD